MSAPHGSTPKPPHPDKTDSARQKTARHAQRMSVKIVAWSFVIGLGLSFLFAFSVAPGSPNLFAALERGLVIGFALAVVIIFGALVMSKGLRRK
ncbi:MAG: hypothetical protein FJX42_05745 [Alphaproteobacteria bacterium]|nr:hypothetical protein [Alphaproteobacteria bacterium]